MQIDADLEQAAIELKTRGSEARVPQSQALYATTSEAWGRNPRAHENEQRWRTASLVHGAILALGEDWKGASQAYSINPHGWSRHTLPAIAPGCERLAALMCVGQAVSFWHLGNEHDAGWASLAALDFFGRVSSQSDDRWRGVATLIQAVTGPHVVTGGMRWILQLLNPNLQPYAFALARQLDAEPGPWSLGQIRATRRITLPPNECLYFFNASTR